MRFEFATATRIVFGPGTLREAGSIAASFGRRALVVGGATPARLEPLLAQLREHDVAAISFQVPGEPTTNLVIAGVEQVRSERCDIVIGMGGGSALDAAKAIAILLTNPGEPLDYLEVVGRGQPLTEPGVPCIAIPTTAGTGSEVTRNAVLAAPEQRMKVSLRSQFMLPRVALVDPELSVDMPPKITASTGLDALTQCIEPFVTPQSNPLADGACREGMRYAARSLRRAYANGSDVEARTGMAIASLCGGLALANAKLGAVHGFASPLGGMFPAPHGMICARLLPLVTAANIQALQERAPTSPALARYDEIAHLLTGDIAALAVDLVGWLEHLRNDLRVPPLSAFGVSKADIPAVVEKAQRASSMQGNPIKLTDEELSKILAAAIAA